MRIEPGTLDVVEIIVALVVKIALGLLILRWDEKRLAKGEPEYLERAWPPATRLTGIVVFQELGVWIHFWKTRGWLNPRGFFLGLCVSAAYVGAASVVLEGVDFLLTEG